MARIVMHGFLMLEDKKQDKKELAFREVPIHDIEIILAIDYEEAKWVVKGWFGRNQKFEDLGENRFSLDGIEYLLRTIRTVTTGMVKNVSPID